MEKVNKRTSLLNWIAVVSGHFLERYEVMTFSFFIPILTPLFFPGSDPHLATLAGMATFAAGYFARPLGGLLFGHIGDRFGRKVALLGSVLCVTIPTLILSCLPTYADIGLIAPLILVSCRVIQGISVGGEYSGATVFFYEYSKVTKQGLSGGLMCASAFLGGVLGTFIGAISTSFFSSSWGWRLPFLIGGIASLMAYSFRRYVIETPVFKTMKVNKKTYPLIQLLKNKKMNMLTALVVGAQGHMLLYTITIYFNSIILKKHGVLESTTLSLNTIILIAWVIVFILLGALADKFSKQKILMSIFTGIILTSLPLMWLLNQNFSFLCLGVFELLMSIFGAGMFCLAASYLPGLFNPEERYSGVALGQTLGQAILGGTAPLIASFFSTWTGEILAPLPLLLSNALVGLFLMTRKMTDKTSVVINDRVVLSE